MLHKTDISNICRWRKKSFISRVIYLVASLGILLGVLGYHGLSPQTALVTPAVPVVNDDDAADYLFYAVYINGYEAGLLAEKESLEQIQDYLQQEASLFYGRPVQASVDVDYLRVFRPLGEANPDQVLAQLRNTMRYKIDALMVTVGDKEVVPVADRDVLESVVATIASTYIPQKENVALQDVQIVEQIDCRHVYCYPEELRDAETVAAILLRGTDRRETYLVSRGDSLWKIAKDYNLSIDDLRGANPQLNGDFLQIGDELSLIVPEPLINVITVERVSQNERISFPTVYVSDNSMWSGQTKVLEKGVLGNRDVIYEVMRENGREVSREVISSKVTSDPKTQKVARGTASIPSMGTGAFLWPVQGGGRLTSPYGWRSGGFHSGIDIATSRGTPVLAADSGVVVYSGRDGGYGNTVVIYHGKYYTRYAHHAENLVQVGQAVTKGEVIARIGSTGRSTAPHLHFEIRTGGIYGSTQNPLNFFKP